jgi:hypothetical protein
MTSTASAYHAYAVPMTSTQHDLTRLTVNLVPRASAALDLSIELSGDSKTGTVNHALQVYAFLLSIVRDGGGVYTRAKDGELERIAFL